MIRSAVPKTLAALAVATFAIAAAAHASPSTDLARAHIKDVASGDLAKINAQYTPASWLNWVGGPLNGSYQGADAIAGVWSKFTKQGPLKVAVHEVTENANPAGSTVTANVIFHGKTAIKVHYVMLYRAGKLIDETWQIDPKLKN